MTSRRVYLSADEPADRALIEDAFGAESLTMHGRFAICDQPVWLDHGRVSARVTPIPLRWYDDRVPTRRVRRRVSREQIARWRRDR